MGLDPHCRISAQSCRGLHRHPAAGPIQGAVLDGLRQMPETDLLLRGQVRDGAGHLEQPVVPPRRQPQASDRQPKQFLSIRSQPAVAPDFPRTEVRIGVESRMRLQAPPLPRPRRLHPFPDRCAPFLRRVEGQLGRTHGRDPDLEIDAVQERAGQSGEVPLDQRRVTAAGPGGVTLVTAGTSPRCLSAMFA